MVRQPQVVALPPIHCHESQIIALRETEGVVLSAEGVNVIEANAVDVKNDKEPSLMQIAKIIFIMGSVMPL